MWRRKTVDDVRRLLREDYHLLPDAIPSPAGMDGWQALLDEGQTARKLAATWWQALMDRAAALRPALAERRIIGRRGRLLFWRIGPGKVTA